MIVEEAGQVINEPEEAYDPDPILLDSEAVKFNPMFLYVFAIM